MRKQDKDFIISRIRTHYQERPEAEELDSLIALDKKARRPVEVFAYILGSIAAIIMGFGMSLVMTDISTTLGMGDGLVPGIIIGIIGMICALINYPIYKVILDKRKTHYAPLIMALSEKLSDGESQNTEA